MLNSHYYSVFLLLTKKLFYVRFEYGRTQKTDLASRRTRSRAIRVLANPNASRGEERTKKVVIMVDPLEAKRLAAKQMEEIKAKERFQRRRQIEAINGAWAMIGLTVGLVIEGHTGLSIPSQVRILESCILCCSFSSKMSTCAYRIPQCGAATFL
ncbi:hypothetical protein T459_18744 [Capsicum annuum]|uniref:Uncharacterized protein n=1 Tax=Capsicum annuum TaxID=4072 RepID=A0A2G2YZN1_CAPAN|nr:hypothetical protein T459_18744 [Capsicum annuum]